MQANSDPVAYWGDAINWLAVSQGYNGPIWDNVAWEKTSPLLGHASTSEQNAFDGQFIIEGETSPFNGAWETGWN